MIIYYSGTGNSRYVAENLARELDCNAYSIFSWSSTFAHYPDTIGIVFPIYSWGVPPHFLKQLKNYLPLATPEKPKRVWAVCTCGDDTGHARKMLEETLSEIDIELIGMWSVQMPNTYVLLPGFDVDSDELAAKKLKASVPRVKHIADKIKRAEYEYDCIEGSWPGLKTSLVYPLFVKWGMKPEKFTVSDRCVSCGKCSESCFIANITMEEGRPKWGNDCLGCLACYHTCPAGAINYGKATVKKGHYRISDYIKDYEKHTEE